MLIEEPEHPYFDLELMVGCIYLSDMNVERPEAIVARVKRALPYVRKEDVILAPDGGMKYLPRDVGFGKIQAMADAATQLRAELCSWKVGAAGS